MQIPVVPHKGNEDSIADGGKHFTLSRQKNTGVVGLDDFPVHAELDAYEEEVSSRASQRS